MEFSEEGGQLAKQPMDVLPAQAITPSLAQPTGTTSLNSASQIIGTVNAHYLKEKEKEYEQTN